MTLCSGILCLFKPVYPRRAGFFPVGDRTTTEGTHRSGNRDTNRSVITVLEHDSVGSVHLAMYSMGRYREAYIARECTQHGTVGRHIHPWYTALLLSERFSDRLSARLSAPHLLSSSCSLRGSLRLISSSLCSLRGSLRLISPSLLPALGGALCAESSRSPLWRLLLTGLTLCHF